MRLAQSRTSGAGRPFRLAGWLAIAAVSALAFASIALANAADPGNTAAEARVGPIVNIAGVDTVRVSVSGSWTWATHTSDCNTNRTGVGYAMAWSDPGQPGNHVADIDAVSVDVGAAVANDYNPADNEVHPTRPEVAGNLFVDPGDPALYESWRSGCGTYDGGLPMGVWGAVDLVTGEPVTCTSESSPSLACLGGSHVYTLEALEQGITACVLMYDVHGGDADAGGAPNGEKEVTAGGSDHNGDNGVEANGNLAIADACAAIVAPEPAPSASPTFGPGSTPDPSASPTPDPSVTPTPDPSVAPEPGVTPGPSATPNPTATLDPDGTPPTSSPDPNGTPGQTGTPSLLATPGPDGTPGLPETAMTRPGSTGGTASGPAVLIGLMALAVGIFAATRRPTRNHPAPPPATDAGPWSTNRDRRSR